MYDFTQLMIFGMGLGFVIAPVLVARLKGKDKNGSATDGPHRRTRK